MSTWSNQWNEFLQIHPSLQLPFPTYQLSIPNNESEELARDEEFWTQVQQLFPSPSGHINLNNGGVCSNMHYVEQAFTHYYHLLNTSPSFFTWRVMELGRDIIKQGLADMIHAEAEEIALFRNASEALNDAIFGIPLEKHDEVVACHQDYIKCISSWKQRELREGIQVNWVELFGHESDEEVIHKYLSAITPKTKVIHLTQVINWNGQILPVEQIAKEAKQRGLIVLLDAAHSFAVLDTDVTKIPCDYLGAALHKWLSGPIAAGMLYIRKNQIAATWPLASAVNPNSDSIKKFEEMSIQLLPNMLALGYAIEFHQLLTTKNIKARLSYLRHSWTDPIATLPNVYFNNSLDDTRCAAIANFNIQGQDPVALEKEIFDRFSIHSIGFIWPNLSGIRITPNIYTPLQDMHQLVEAVTTIAKEKQ